MTDQNDSRLLMPLEAISTGAAALVFALGCLVLIGWTFDIAFLKSCSADMVTMKANTALAFVLIGISLWLLQPSRAHCRAPRIVGRVCALLVALVGLATLLEYASGWNLGIDQLLFTEPPHAVHTLSPGIMAPNTAFVFLLIGLSLLLLDVQLRNGRRPARYLILIQGVISLLALAGYVADATMFYAPSQTATSMSLPAALAGVFAFVGLVWHVRLGKCPRS